MRSERTKRMWAALFGATAASVAKTFPLKASASIVNDIDLSKLAMGRTYDYTIPAIDGLRMKDELMMNTMGYYKVREHLNAAIDEYVLPHNIKQKEVFLLHQGTGHRFLVEENSEPGTYLVQIHNETVEEIKEDVKKKEADQTMSYLERTFVKKINEVLR
jgi:hypothetical protein